MKYRKTIAAALCAVLILGGCDNSYNGGDDLKAQLDLLQSRYDRLSDENAELQGAKESADEQLDLLQKENSELEAKVTKLEARLADQEKIIYKGGWYTIKYLGDERGEDGTAVTVLQITEQYTPIIRLDTKASGIAAGVTVIGGWYEFANENIDENGYLYLISDEELIPDDAELPFVAEKYIKLRFRNSDSEQYSMFDDIDYTGEIYRLFNGSLSVVGAVVDRDDGVKYDSTENVLSVVSNAPISVFDDNTQVQRKKN